MGQVCKPLHDFRKRRIKREEKRKESKRESIIHLKQDKSGASVTKNGNSFDGLLARVGWPIHW